MSPKPPKHKTVQSGKPGKIDTWPESFPPPDEIASQVTYVGNGKHKTYPSPDGEWQPYYQPGHGRCDHYELGSWHLVEAALRDAIRAGCVQFDPANPNLQFPSRAWGYINGILHEARLHNEENGEYHAFPVSPAFQLIDPEGVLQGAPDVNIPTTA